MKIRKLTEYEKAVAQQEQQVKKESKGKQTNKTKAEQGKKWYDDPFQSWLNHEI